MEAIKENKKLIAATLVSMVGVYYSAVLANRILKRTTVDIYIKIGNNKCIGGCDHGKA